MNTYFKDLTERVIASFAGGALTVTGLDAVNVLTLDWKAALGVGGGTALVSLLKALAARKVGDPNTASLAKE
ncbi:holin [Amycolatopsis palatopharyngis]|uniref:holin n=1 Tax=Amycolatopsis palatopharyngis TaxID=187982 RepID=UPI000E21C7F1|nr:holin [Amycolatopsis palatopharyngis]